MTENYYTLSNYSDHTTFGGCIYLSDFNTDFRGKDQNESSIAKRIASDWKFDKTCKVQSENRDRQAKYKKGLSK